MRACRCVPKGLSLNLKMFFISPVFFFFGRKNHFSTEGWLLVFPFLVSFKILVPRRSLWTWTVFRSCETDFDEFFFFFLNFFLYFVVQSILVWPGQVFLIVYHRLHYPSLKIVVVIINFVCLSLKLVFELSLWNWGIKSLMMTSEKCTCIRTTIAPLVITSKGKRSTQARGALLTGPESCVSVYFLSLSPTTLSVFYFFFLFFVSFFLIYVSVTYLQKYSRYKLHFFAGWWTLWVSGSLLIFELIRLFLHLINLINVWFWWTERRRNASAM